MKINVNGVWKDTKPLVNVGGSWKPVNTGWVNVGGTWKKFYTSSFDYHITSDQVNFNLFKTIGIPDGDTINITVDAGVTISSTSTATAAFNVGNAYDGKVITLTNKGIISGKGGNGGRGGSITTSRPTNGGSGGAGGPALYVRTSTKLILDNQGTIRSGGGGGAGGGGVIFSASAFQGFYTGGGGGAGQGTPNGSPGSRGTSAAPRNNYLGKNGSGTSGGAGGYTSAWRWQRGGNGGRGGSWGQNGANGGNGSNPGGNGWNSAGGRGGRAGYAIDGNSYVDVQTVGTILGPRVN